MAAAASVGAAEPGEPAGWGSHVQAARPRSVILICLDTVRADHLGFLGYTRHDTTPALDALAAQSIVFEDVTASACWTKPSVPSYFTGLPPAGHGVFRGSTETADRLESDVLADQATTLAERFSAAGYKTAAMLHNAQLAPGRGLEQGFDSYEEGSLDAAQLADAAIRWIDGLDDEQPYFLYLHLLDAHWPFAVPDAAALRFAPREALLLLRSRDWRSLLDELNDGTRVLSAEEQAGLLGLYDSALRYSDEQLGRVFQRLAQKDVLDETVIAVVADHGEEFREHGRYGHGHGLYENLTRVGWLLHAPGHAPERRAQPVSLVDVHPTLLSAAGLPAPALPFAVDRLAQPAASAPLFSEHLQGSHYAQSLRVGTHKLVRRFESRAVGLPIHALEIGTRWEAELTPEGVASQLKPREESPYDPAELRGAITAVKGSRLTIAGKTVKLEDETTVYGEETTLAALQPGRVVKVVGEWEDDEFVAEKIKVYEEGADATAEVRGGVTRREAAGDQGTVWLGDIPITFTQQTEWKGVTASPRMERADVQRILAEGAAASGFTLQFSLYDLAADPQELAPIESVGASDEGSEELQSLSHQLDRIGRTCLAAGAWSAGASALDPATLEALRSLGYVR